VFYTKNKLVKKIKQEKYGKQVEEKLNQPAFAIVVSSAVYIPT